VEIPAVAVVKSLWPKYHEEKPLPTIPIVALKANNPIKYYLFIIKSLFVINSLKHTKY
jgi:hypothetical protein